jgi:hypothetical protein
MRVLYNLISIVLLSCSNVTTTETTVQSKENVDDRTRLLQGVWAFNEEENALYEISGDSIYYVEHSEAMIPYNLVRDTLEIMYDGFSTKNIIQKLTNDSLVFKTEIGEVNRLYRRK